MTDKSRMKETSLRDVYDRLMHINQETFAGSEYDIAYHALSGALHCGEGLKQIQYLNEVKRRADEELAWTDAHAPEYEHSTQAAARRGHQSVFKNLGNMASARAVIIQTEARQHAKDSDRARNVISTSSSGD